ncbi:homeobox protein Dlx4b-like, partial [Numida meleagris]|uniref:homeobox protein Dlx4b-like n=1 Tax=Numida meleagris TaxID=8996 RepID=UPI000B3E2751
MTMSSVTESLLGSDPSKTSFLELGHPSPPHYPLHGLHPAGHPQHDPSPFASYSRPGSYPYPGGPPPPPHGGPYLPYPPQHPPAGLAHGAGLQDA